MYQKLHTFLFAIALLALSVGCTRVQGGEVIGAGIGAEDVVLIKQAEGDSAAATSYHYTYSDLAYDRSEHVYTTPRRYRHTYVYSPTVVYRDYSYAHRYYRPRYYYEGGCHGCTGWPWLSRHGYRIAR